jgi:hypothetical protein
MASDRRSGGGKRGGRPAGGGEGGNPAPDGCYPVMFAEGNFDFRVVKVGLRIVSGRQLLIAAETHPRDDLSLCVIYPNGVVEDVALDQELDLEGRGADRFVAYWRYRTFRFKLDGVLHHWPRPAIRGADIYELGPVVEPKGVFHQRGKRFGDHEIWRHDVVDISSPKIHRFVSAWNPGGGAQYWIIINGVSQAVVRPTVSFERAVELAFPSADTHDLSRWTVTYRFAADDPSHGKLKIGEGVTVKLVGTTFDVLTNVFF